MNGCEDVGPWAGRPRAEMMKSDEVEAMLHLHALGWPPRNRRPLLPKLINKPPEQPAPADPLPHVYEKSPHPRGTNRSYRPHQKRSIPA